jgi:predicted transcriptional regulator
VTFDGHRSDDYGVYIFSTSDYGESWKAIRNGIPDSAGSVHVVREHPRNANLLFAGTEFGLWVSWDHGANWTALKNNFPTVPVDDIEIQARDNDLVLATHGRSIWIFDDLTPIEKMDASVAGSPLTFFQPRTATTWSMRNRRWSAGQKMFTAKNPAYGALLSYYLKEAVPAETPKKGKDDKDKKEAAEEKPKPESKSDAAEKKEGKVKITVTDKDGKVVREFDGPGAAGVNRTNWDLRSNAPAEPTPEQLEAIAAGFGFGPRGPVVDPGEYTIKIKAGDHEATQKAMVEEDNRITISAADRAARREAINQLYAMAKTTDKDRSTIEGIQTALKATREQWKKDAGKPNTTKIPDDIVKAADELQKKVDAVAEKFVREREGLGNAGPPFEWKPDPLPNQVQNLLNDLDGFTAAPDGQQKEKLAELTPLVTDASVAVKNISEVELPALNKKMNDAGIPHIVPAPPQPRGGRGGEEESEPFR